MKIAAAVVACLICAGCSLPATIVETGEVLLDAAPAGLGALAGFLTAGTGLGIIIGAFVGWLVGDDVDTRLALEAAKAENQQLREDAVPSNTADAVAATADALGAWAWPVGIATVAIVVLLIWRGWSAGRRLKRVEAAVRR